MIIQESLIISGLSGYIGLVLGVGLLELISSQMPPSDFFKNPQADIRIALGATVLLIIAGALAGLFPALKAAGIRPIEALRDE
jgi:putative ABC transport system permease protein